MLRHAVDAAKVAAVGDRDSQVRDGALERVDQLRRTRLSAVKLNGRCVVHQHHGLYAYVRSPLRHHIGSLADIGYVVQESLPPMAACYRASPSNSVIQPAIGGQAARLSARAMQAAPAPRSSAQEQPLRPVSLSQVSWELAFWWTGAAERLASALRRPDWVQNGGAHLLPESFRAFQIQVRSH